MGGMGGGADGTVTAPVVFVGYGISEPSVGFDELKGMNLKGKIVLLLSDAPGRDDPKSPLQAKKELKDKYFPAPPQGDMMAQMMRGGPQRFNKLTEIAKLEPAAIVQVSNAGNDAAIFNALSMVRTPSDERPIINKPRRRLSLAGVAGGMGGGRGGAAATQITREMANFLLEGTGQSIDDLKKKIESTMKPASMDIPGAKLTIATTSKTALVRGTNVLGIIEGSDPKLKDEYFVVGAHYDHNGAWEGYVWNGADDNGSGSVGVLNIAKAIAASPVKPKRSIVFALWTGEEEGLLGSRYYAANPIYPIEKTVGYLNYDMISRPYDAEMLARTMRAVQRRRRRRGDRQEGPRPLVRQRQPDRGHALRRHRPGDEPVRRARPGLPLQRPGRRQRRLRPRLLRLGQGPLHLLHGRHDGRLPSAERQRRKGQRRAHRQDQPARLPDHLRFRGQISFLAGGRLRPAPSFQDGVKPNL